MTKKTKRRIKIINELVKNYKKIQSFDDNIDEIFGTAHFDSPFFDAIYIMFDAYTQSVQNEVGDKYDWITWYIYECQCGDVPMEADGNDILTIEQLVELIEK